MNKHDGYVYVSQFHHEQKYVYSCFQFATKICIRCLLSYDFRYCDAFGMYDTII